MPSTRSCLIQSFRGLRSGLLLKALRYSKANDSEEYPAAHAEKYQDQGRDGHVYALGEFVGHTNRAGRSVWPWLPAREATTARRMRMAMRMGRNTGRSIMRTTEQSQSAAISAPPSHTSWEMGSDPPKSRVTPLGEARPQRNAQTRRRQRIHE